MAPSVYLLYPDIGMAAAQYRLDRLNASMQRAATAGYEGAFWAWESAFTGLDTSTWRAADTNEQHISADIPLSMRLFYRMTLNMTFLRDVAWPVANASCYFWAGRLVQDPTTGNYTVKNIIPPDEAAGIVNDSVYTNAAAGQTLEFCMEAAALLNTSVPATWASLASHVYIPLNASAYPGGPVHNEYTGYNGHLINQADVALLQYPLGLQFPANIAKNDLDYWIGQTNYGSFFTGDSSYSIAYLGLGTRTQADNQFGIAFNHIEPHFNVWTETVAGGTQHFITGAGGYLQNFLFGYSGLRVSAPGTLSFTNVQPLLPPFNVSRVVFHGMHLGGVAFDFSYDDASICVQLSAPQPAVASSSTGLQLYLPASSKSLPVTASSTCVPIQPVEILTTNV
jgi:trehalose/maltose hydrolase-like predicted phosphorylase